MKFKKYIKKFGLFLSFAFALIICMSVSSKAYYVDNNGNLVSDNLISNELDFDVTNQTFNSYYIAHVYTLNDFITENGVYSFSISYTQSVTNACAIELRSNGSFINANLGIDLSGSLTMSNININLNNTYHIRIFATYQTGTTKSIKFYNSMLNSGSSVLPYEPYGIYYSQVNYDNYGSSQYSQGYNDAYNDIYGALADTNISQHIIYVSSAMYDSTGEQFLQRGVFHSVGVENDYYSLGSLSPQTVNNIYVVTFGFDSNYILDSFGWTPNGWTPNGWTGMSLEFSGYSVDNTTNISYNGTYYGWFNLHDVYSGPCDSVTLRFSLAGSVDSIKFYINGKVFDIMSSVDAYNNGYEQGTNYGKQIGYDEGFSAGVSSVDISGSNYQKLLWTIGATPFESFKTIWNVDIFGLNISGIILGGLMALLVLYLIKKIWK